MANKLDLCGFGADLIMEGVVAVPKLLLQNYHRLGLNEEELILILQLLSLREKKAYPTPGDLSGLMGIGADRVESMLGRLMEEKVLSVDKALEPESGKLVPTYSLHGLMEKLSDIWAMEKAKSLVERKRAAKNQPAKPKLEDSAGNIIKAFEREFGRPLTEIECSNILEWQSAYSQELILEALKRAVLNQTTSWRYMDSILREWDKKNLRTLQEVFEDDARFQARQSQSKGGKGRTSTKSGSLKDKYKDIYL